MATVPERPEKPLRPCDYPNIMLKPMQPAPDFEAEASCLYPPEVERNVEEIIQEGLLVTNGSKRQNNSPYIR